MLSASLPWQWLHTVLCGWSGYDRIQSLGGWPWSYSPGEWQAAVTFIWRAQRCETGVTSHLSGSLGNDILSGSCVVVDVTVNI